MKTIGIWTIKGGVGKTATAVNVAYAAARDGVRTLVVDLDPQGAASYYLRVPARLPGGARNLLRRGSDLAALVRPTEFDNLAILPADFSYRHLDLQLEGRKKPGRRLADRLGTLAGGFDLALLDCAPSVSLVSEAVLRASDALLVPVIPSTLSMRTLDQVRRFVSSQGKRRPLLLPFLSMVDRRKRLHRETAAACLAGPAFLQTTIPFASVVERMGLTRAPVAATLPSQPAAHAFTALWNEVRLKIGV